MIDDILVLISRKVIGDWEEGGGFGILGVEEILLG